MPDGGGEGIVSMSFEVGILSTVFAGLVAVSELRR